MSKQKIRKSLNGLDVFALLEEVKEAIEGSWIQKVYGEKDRWEIALQGKSICLDLRGWIYVGKCIAPRPDKPSPFCSFLRKHLVGKVERLEQRDRDRVIRLNVREKKLIVELFRKGNIILTDEEGSVQRSLKKADKVYPWEYSMGEISEIDRVMTTKKRNLVKSLAVDYGLGGLYAEELCLRSEIDKNSIALVKDENERLAHELDGLLTELREGKKPMIILNGGEAIDVVPIEMGVYKGFERKNFESFNDAIIQYLLSTLPAKPPEAEDRILSMQRKRLKELEEESKKLRSIIEWIYANYQEAGELDQVELDGYKVELDRSKSLESNISSIYEMAKSKEEKVEKIKRAMASTRKKIEKKEKWKPSKRWWFEKFRWALTSEGLLVIGGKDARSNDALVKKHLKDGDIYAHADIKGAPSVLLKDGLNASEASKREACHFALIFSKAWKVQRPSRTYWVNSDQVSKTPPSGEFLPRGAFMISGRRNYIDDLELLADIGWVEYKGEKRLVCSPPGVLKSYVRIEPDEEKKRKDLVKRLSKHFEAHPDAVDSILPGGGREV